MTFDTIFCNSTEFQTPNAHITYSTMSKSPSLRRIQADVRELAIDPSDRYHAAPLEDDMFEWCVRIDGKEKEIVTREPKLTLRLLRGAIQCLKRLLLLLCIYFSRRIF
jgi:hypothetical protein